VESRQQQKAEKVSNIPPTFLKAFPREKVPLVEPPNVREGRETTVFLISIPLPPSGYYLVLSTGLK
jgi:hypothetical protein